MVNSKIRIATESDSKAILEIYAPYIKNTSITFEYKVPGIQEFTQRIKRIKEKYPYLIYEVDGKIIGYAYADKHGEREAFKWSVNYSIYLVPQYHGKGVAKELYTVLTQLLRLQGYYNAYAIITSPNVQSERFHKSFGFRPAGVLRNVGYKLGEWHDVSYYELLIQELYRNPEEPKSINEIENIEEIIDKIF